MMVAATNRPADIPTINSARENRGVLVIATSGIGSLSDNQIGRHDIGSIGTADNMRERALDRSAAENT
jgi:hypothetical protein